jgi:hypothetical protein
MGSSNSHDFRFFFFFFSMSDVRQIKLFQRHGCWVSLWVLASKWHKSFVVRTCSPALSTH